MGGKILQLNLTEGQKVASGERVGFVDTTQLYIEKNTTPNCKTSTE
jgi:multidrug efflux pump subunit AcrA (membrane-fusion protein)